MLRRRRRREGVPARRRQRCRAPYHLQLASSALVVLKYMPPNVTPPLVLRYGATDVPIIPACQPVQQLAAGQQTERSWPKHHPPRSRGRSRCGSSLSLWRQAARHYGRSRSAGAQRARIVSIGCRFTAIQQQNVIAPLALRRRQDGGQRLYAGDEHEPQRDRNHQRVSGRAGRQVKPCSCAMLRTCMTVFRFRPIR